MRQLRRRQRAREGGDCDHEDDQTDQRHALQERVLLLFEGQQRERHGGKPE